ncbi:MAG: endolytic transglycosylase MltG, partial [Actinobacteria bacterium]|nr:endolytic transglycosylase MltG [Actinomycetota bacterium]
MKKKFLLAIFIILAVVLVFTGCQKITQADVGMQGTRWLVLLYKMTEDGSDAQAYELISQVEETLNQEFGNGEKTYVELANTGSAKDKYRILVRQNQLMEEALVKLKGKEALREIEGKYSLEEITQTDVDSLAFKYQFSAFQKGAQEELIVINLTTTEVEFIAKLKEQGYIKSELAFNFVLKRKGWQGKIEPGGYNISKGMNAWQLADTLVNHPYQKWTVIPEGLRATEIAEKLQEKLGWANTTKAEFLSSSKEGYLFPDTYLLNLDYTGKDTAKRMENQ